MRPSDLPPAEAYDHGTRARYVSGCRCAQCREANVDLYHERESRARAAALELGPRTSSHCTGVNEKECPRGTKLRSDSIGNLCAACRKHLVWNGLVSAGAARKHLLYLSGQGIGRRAVVDASDVSDTTIQKIRSGAKTNIRRDTEKRILDVDLDARSDCSLVPAAETWRMVRELIEEHGYTRAQLSKRLGQGGRALQLGKKQITARNAMKVRRIFEDAEGTNARRLP